MLRRTFITVLDWQCNSLQKAGMKQEVSDEADVMANAVAATCDEY
jgi:hypothetical protein